MIFYTLMVLPAEATSNESTKIVLKDKKIALVDPTFTYAAYQNGSFYDFYDKYSPGIQYNSNITINTDLHLLKDRPIPHQPFYYHGDPTSTTIPYKEYFDHLQQNIGDKKLNVTNLTDADVHEGKIFNEDKKNAYDVLILFHNEYVTQSEYDNLKRFVMNGGTIIFTEANELFAEVSYNKTSDSITLVNGHFWKFDGKVAKPSVGERWLKENKEWKGSNFLDVSTNKVLFRNNPFNYTHVEENYVTNPNAKILIDFQAFNITEPFSYATVAAYMLNYGNGKVIHLGLWTHTLRENVEFLEYFDNVILPRIIGNNAYNNSETGLLCPDTCNNTIFYNNTVHDNEWSGIMFSGGTYNNTATKNNAFNEEIGIHIDSSKSNKIYDNLFKSNDEDIVIEGNSPNNQMYNNTLSADHNYMYFENQLGNNTQK